jgi:hypothetical protein
MSEVASFVNENQFEGGESAYECVAFSAALCRYAGKPGQSPTGTGEQVDQLADYWYARLEGSSNASNTNGMSLQAEYTMLQGLGLKYYPSSTSLNYIKAWLALGYPLLICGAETGMHDLDLGDRVPYAWTPTGNHCIVASGIASDGNLLVRDTASIAPTGVRPGPRRYDASKLQLISATAISLPWLPVQPQGFDPTKGGTHMNTPQGWHDDGATLTAPNGIKVVRGFRSYILAHDWDSGNVPLVAEFGTSQLEASNTSLGAGVQQIFRWSMLGYTVSRGVFLEWIGQELIFARSQVTKYYTQVASLQTQLTPDSASAKEQESTLQTQIAALQVELAAEQSKVTDLGTQVTSLQSQLTDAEQQQGIPQTVVDARLQAIGQLAAQPFNKVA